MTSRPPATRRRFLVWTGALAGASGARAPSLFAAAAIGIPPQPYFANVGRAVARMAELGASLAPADAKEIAVLAQEETTSAVAKAEQILNRYALALVDIAANRSVQIFAGGAQRTLTEQGWRMFLVRVSNPATRRDSLSCTTGGADATDKTFGYTPGFMWGPSGAQRSFLLDTVN